MDHYLQVCSYSGVKRQVCFLVSLEGACSFFCIVLEASKLSHEILESRHERNNDCSATDTSGNESERVLRFVYIDASCPEGEEWCSEKAACSSPLLCLPTTLDRAVYVPQVAPYTPPVDAQAPVLLLMQLPGDSAISPVVPGPHILESWVTGGQVLLGLTSLHSKLYML